MSMRPLIAGFVVAEIVLNAASMTPEMAAGVDVAHR